MLHPAIVRGLVAIVVLLLLAPRVAGAEEGKRAIYDLVIVGGRVMDPETGLDGMRNVGIAASSRR